MYFARSTREMKPKKTPRLLMKHVHIDSCGVLIRCERFVYFCRSFIFAAREILVIGSDSRESDLSSCFSKISKIRKRWKASPPSLSCSFLYYADGLLVNQFSLKRDIKSTTATNASESLTTHFAAKPPAFTAAYSAWEFPRGNKHLLSFPILEDTFPENIFN